MAASPIALVRSTVLAPIVRFLDQEGVTYENLFEAAKLSPRLIERPNDLFPLAQGFALSEQIARMCGLDDIGLRAASHVAITDFGQLGDIVCGAATLSEALHSLIRGVTAFNTGERLSLEWRGERLLFCHRFAIRAAPGERHLFTRGHDQGCPTCAGPGVETGPDLTPREREGPETPV